jgi:16S rRNA (uracil1498-N3)-methyltransferase
MKKIHRFIGRFELSADRLLIRDADLVHQIRAVLKLQIGERILLADGRGAEALADIAAVDKAAVEVSIVERRVSVEPKKRVTLYCAILKRDNFEYAVQKAVECGVSSIVPLITARTVKLGLNAARLASIVREAAEQSGRGRIPEVAAPRKFDAAIKDALANDANYFFDASEKDWDQPRPSIKTVGVWIGPEGGWEDFELEAAKAKGFIISSLGVLTLRAETAATVAVYLAVR